MLARFHMNQLIEQIKSSFATVEKPPSCCLTNSKEGQEPAALEKEFANIPTWNTLTVNFLDSTPDGFGSALSFFSDEAFRYYLPAYLVASIQEKLKRADPVFYLTHGLDNTSAENYLNPRRYGQRTWHDYAIYRHSVFNSEQATAILAYLKYQVATGNRTKLERQQISEAIRNYWGKRAG